MLKGRPANQPAVRPWVVVTIERPWDDEKIRRFGTVDDVLGERTLDEVVQAMANAHHPGGEALPERYSLLVRKGPEGDCEAADHDAPARVLLGDMSGRDGGSSVYQLRVQVIPVCEDDGTEREPAERHSDSLPEPASEDRALVARPEVGGPAPEAEARAEPVTVPDVAAKKQRGYLRKTDVLRAQLQPKVEALDFSGLFVGNFGPCSEASVSRPRVSLLSAVEANKYLMLANQYRRAGEWEQAARHYRTLIAHDPENKDFWFLLGKVEEGRGDCRQALSALRNALRLGHASARAEIARLHAAHGGETGGDDSLVALWRAELPGVQSSEGTRQ